MKLLSIVSLVCVFVSQTALADIISTPINENRDESVIDMQFVDNVNWEEPVFAGRTEQRDIAEFKEVMEPTEVEWQGQLAVLKEIPYSYPELTRNQLNRQVLGKVDKEEEAAEQADGQE